MNKLKLVWSRTKGVITSVLVFILVLEFANTFLQLGANQIEIITLVLVFEGWFSYCVVVARGRASL